MRYRVRARLPFVAGSGNAGHAQANMDVTRGQAQPIGPTGEQVVSAVLVTATAEVYLADFPLSGDALGLGRADTAADWLQARLPFIVMPGDLALPDQPDYPFIEVHECHHDETPPTPCVVRRRWPPPPRGPWRAPAGGHEPYPAGWVVAHAGQLWRCAIAGAVWEPGVAGWTVVS